MKLNATSEIVYFILQINDMNFVSSHFFVWKTKEIYKRTYGGWFASHLFPALEIKPFI